MLPPLIADGNPNCAHLPAIPIDSPARVKRFVTMANALMCRADAQAMIAIALRFDPTMRITAPDLLIAIDRMSNNAASALEHYVLRRFQELNWESHSLTLKWSKHWSSKSDFDSGEITKRFD
jgi:hypothetical protein